MSFPWHHPQPPYPAPDAGPTLINISDDDLEVEVLLVDHHEGAHAQESVTLADDAAPAGDEELEAVQQLEAELEAAQQLEADYDQEYYEPAPGEHDEPAPGPVEVLHQVAHALHDVAVILEETAFVPGLPANHHIPHVLPSHGEPGLPLAVHPIQCWRVLREGQELWLNTCPSVVFCPPGQVSFYHIDVYYHYS